MINNKLMLGFDDLAMMGCVQSSIKSRKECITTLSDGMLPIFASPMPSVIDENNYKKFIENKINVVIPRTVNFETRLSLINEVFVAVGIDEFKRMFINDDCLIKETNSKMYVCIDIANGHMSYLHNLILTAKLKFKKDIVIMMGNIINPLLYPKLAEIGVDYVRVSVGTGSICTTSVVSGVHATIPYIMEGLMSAKKDVVAEYNRINNTRKDVDPYLYEVAIGDTVIKVPVETLDKFDLKTTDKKKQTSEITPDIYTVPKIIVDGGINSFDKINKSLALGADYVMLGGMLAKTEEACGDIVDNEDGRFHVYYGMSTYRAQKQCGIKDEDLRPEEGVTKLVKIEYRLKDLVGKIDFYLKEAMSLTDSRTLDDFKSGNVAFYPISSSAFNNYIADK